MSTSITDDDLQIRHTTLHLVLAALGYISDDSSHATIRQVQARFDEAVAGGRMVRNSGHYAVTRAYYEQQKKRNAEQSRKR
jgi:hypothetical protein